MNYRAVVIAILLGILAPASVSQEYRELEGQYALTSDQMIDPPAGTKADRVAFFIVGQPAREIYNGMTAPTSKDACASELLTKSTGTLICSKNVTTKQYQCTFGVLLRSGKAVDVKVC